MLRAYMWGRCVSLAVAICTSAVPILVCPTARAAGPNVAFLEGAVPAGVSLVAKTLLLLLAALLVA